MHIWQQILDFEPFLRFLDIQAELLGPDDVVLRLTPRQEIANHLGGLHGGAQFTLGEATALTRKRQSLTFEQAYVTIRLSCCRRYQLSCPQPQLRCC